MNIELKITDDGSHTLFNKDLNEHYHSTFGAINESMHVYIQAGLNYTLEKTKTINILEVGFGTGLNTLLTCLETLSNSTIQKINYTTLEPYPLDASIYKQLNFVQQLNHPQSEFIFNAIHQQAWNTTQQIIENKFILSKQKIAIADFKNNNSPFHLIYFDAFAPEIQPNLWTETIFIALYNCMHNQSSLITYCAKGSVKRALKSASFTIENIAGPIGKREITRGIKS